MAENEINNSNQKISKSELEHIKELLRLYETQLQSLAERIDTKLDKIYDNFLIFVEKRTMDAKEIESLKSIIEKESLNTKSIQEAIDGINNRLHLQDVSSAKKIGWLATAGGLIGGIIFKLIELWYHF